METIEQRIRHLKRPRLLVRAARFAIADYRRERDQRRLTRQGALLPAGKALEQLLDREAAFEAARCRGDATYRPARHVEILAAIMAEATLYRQPRRGAA